MVQLEGVTQQKAAMFEETTAVTKSLAEKARHLRSVLDRFDTGGEDRKAQTADQPEAAPKARAGRRVSSSANALQGNLAVVETEAELDPVWEEF